MNSAVEHELNLRIKIVVDCPKAIDEFENGCRFYCRTAKRLRAQLPGVSVGGVIAGAPEEREERRFFSICHREEAPLDFFCRLEPGEFQEEERQRLGRLLRIYGFEKTEIFSGSLSGSVDKITLICNNGKENQNENQRFYID